MSAAQGASSLRRTRSNSWPATQPSCKASTPHSTITYPKTPMDTAGKHASGFKQRVEALQDMADLSRDTAQNVSLTRVSDETRTIKGSG